MKEQQFSAPSPYDHTPTERLGSSIPRYADGAEPHTSPIPRSSVDPHERASDPSFQKAEFLFDPRNPRGIKLHDDSLTRRNQLHEELMSRSFTFDELEEQADHDNPHYQILLDARKELDAHSEPLRSRFFRQRQNRRKYKDEMQTARDVFESARHAYIESKLPPQDSITTLAHLSTARAELAEVTYQARQGKLFSNKTAVDALAEAEYKYTTLRDTYFDEQLQIHNPGTTKKDRQELRASLKDHERGALAGEEANTYLSEVSDDNKKSVFRKMTDRYNKLGRSQKIIAGVGAVALSGIGFGAIGGFAAIGGVAAVKFGRNYLKNEARRLEDANDLQTQQESSVLHAGTLESSLQERTLIEESRRRKDTLFAISQTSYSEQRRSAITGESARISSDRRTSLGKAALITAIPFAGGAAGAVLEQFVPTLSHGLFRERGLPTFNFPSLFTDDQPTNVPEAEEIQSPPPAEPDTEQQPPSSSQEPIVDPRQQYLYDTYAGRTINISLSGQNSSIWQEVSKTVAADRPTALFSERERLTGNIVNEILRQNPTINPESVSVGQQFSIKLPS